MKLTDLTAHLRAALGFDTAAPSSGNDPWQQAQGGFIHEVLGAMDEKQSRIDGSIAEGNAGRWSGDLTDSDRAAAAILNVFLASGFHQLKGWSEADKLKALDASGVGALITATVAAMHLPGWAVAAGVDPARVGIGAMYSCQDLVRRMLRRKYVLSPVQHRVLVCGLIEASDSVQPGPEQLEAAVLDWADANPAANTDELRKLFETCGGEDSGHEVALRLKPRFCDVPPTCALPSEALVVDGIVTPEQHRLLAEWVDHWTHLHAELSVAEGLTTPEIMGATSKRFLKQSAVKTRLNEFLDLHAEVYRTNDGKSPFPNVPLHFEYLDPEQLGWFLSTNLASADRLEKTFDNAWFAPRVEAYRAWQALPADARWWLQLSENDDHDGVKAPAPLVLPVSATETLFDRLAQVTSPKPTAKWISSMKALADSDRAAEIRNAITTWLDALEATGKSSERTKLWHLASCYVGFAQTMLPIISLYGGPRQAALRWMCMSSHSKLYSDNSGDFGSSRHPAMLTDSATAAVRGAAWALASTGTDAAVGALVLTTQRLIVRTSGLGGTNSYRSLAAANACILALSEIGTPSAVMALDRILRGTRDGSVAKQIEKAKARAAEKAGLTVSELEELSVPTHDLDAAGRTEISIGAGAGLIAIDGTSAVAVTWRTPEGTVTKSLPAAMKSAADEVKAVKARVKGIEADLALLPWRIQRLWLDNRRWAEGAWRQRYVEHPLTGAVSRRLIWNAYDGGRRTSGIWLDGKLVNVAGSPVSLDNAEMSLWHPIDCDVAEVMAWRERLGALGIVQPFKQAHREVYIVTDAERRTDLYSNRFAGHIIKQQQMVALARLGGWSMTAHMGYDGGMGKYPSRIALPNAGLIAEYWLEGTGGDNDFTPNGAYLYLSTDQLRFVRPADMSKATSSLGRATSEIAGEVVSIAEVPPLVLSEIMRHCDLFVGVASIANDPNWVDAGTDVARGHWREQANIYWQGQSFGEIGAAGETRRMLLQALLPSLTIGKVARIDGRFLRVQGKRRAYKIHLGSGNILMEPNDHYLCIVPKSDVVGAKVSLRLPFEGDTVLSIILSKAAMLAADDKISDQTILSQIGR